MRRLRFVVAASVAGVFCLDGLAATRVEAAVPRAEVRGVDDKALRREIEDAIGAAPAPTSRLEARRRANDAQAQATAVLRSEGYYDATVTPDIGEGDAPRAFIAVDIGPKSLIADPGIEWLDATPAPEAVTAAQKAMALKPGAPARAVDVLAAEGRIIAALQNLGYADAAAKPREVVVDHADHSMRPSFRIAAGAVARLGPVKLDTKGRTHPGWLEKLTPWRLGAAYRPALIATLERRLVDTGAYDTVSVALAPADQAVDGRRPVLVSLIERPKGSLELGVSYSTSEGAGVDSRWSIYDRLGLGDTIATTAQLAQIESRLQTALSLPHWGKPDQTLKLAVAIYRDNTPAYDLIGAGLSADLTHRFGKLSYLTYGASFDETQTMEKEAADYITGKHLRLLSTFGLLSAFNLDASNSPLNPTSGFRLTGRVEPKANFGDGPIAYLKASAQASGYVPLLGPDWTVLAMRVRVGSILGGSVPAVPAADRFYAGGGGSVRGFGYQEVGPRYPDNTPEGGISLFESSFEIRQRVTQRWGVVAFVDAGSVGEQLEPNFKHPEIGAGVGVRYDLGFGPIRLDLATPVVRQTGDAGLQVYLSIGQSF